MKFGFESMVNWSFEEVRVNTPNLESKLNMYAVASFPLIIFWQNKVTIIISLTYLRGLEVAELTEEDMPLVF